jgi:hypothetical protein
VRPRESFLRDYSDVHVFFTCDLLKLNIILTIHFCHSIQTGHYPFFAVTSKQWQQQAKYVITRA